MLFVVLLKDTYKHWIKLFYLSYHLLCFSKNSQDLFLSQRTSIFFFFTFSWFCFFWRDFFRRRCKQNQQSRKMKICFIKDANIYFVFYVLGNWRLVGVFILNWPQIWFPYHKLFWFQKILIKITKSLWKL